MAAQQRHLRLPLLLRRQFLDVMNLTRGERGHRQAVFEQEAIAGQRWQPRPGRQNPNQIERIGCRKRYVGIAARLAAHIAQRSYGLRRRKLLTGKSRDKAAAANLSAGLQSAATAQDFAPWRQPLRFAREQFPKNHAPAAQQRAYDLFDGLILALSRWRTGPAHQRPTSGIRHPKQRQTALVPR